MITNLHGPYGEGQQLRYKERYNKKKENHSKYGRHSEIVSQKKELQVIVK